MRPLMCLTSCFSIIGPLQDPAIDVPYLQMKEWLGLWQSSGAVQDVVKPVWRIAVDALAATAEQVRAHKVRGPLAALVVSLMGLGWELDAADEWISDQGVPFRFSGAADSTLAAQKAGILQELEPPSSGCYGAKPRFVGTGRG